MSSFQMVPEENSHAFQKDQVKTGLFQETLFNTQNLSLNIKTDSEITPLLWDANKEVDSQLLLTGG
jgi:hypothetical protein